jgi:hypothetical protein
MKCQKLWGLLVLCAPAFADPSPADLAAHKAAAARVVGLIEAAQSAGEASRLKTPEFMGLIRAVSDEGKVLRSGVYAASELNALLDTCDAANRVSVSLTLFGVKARIAPGSTPQQIQEEVMALGTINTVVFQEQLKEVLPFLLRYLAKEVAPMTEFVASLKPAEFTDVRRQGLAQARAGLLQIYAGALQSATDARYGEAYRLTVLAVVAETSDAFAATLEMPVRRQLHERARAASVAAAEPYKRHLSRIVESLGSQRCDALCAVHLAALQR